MRRSCLSFVIGAAAIAGCNESDSSSPTQIRWEAASRLAPDTTMTGTVIPNPGARKTPSAVALLEADGTVIQLFGDQAAALATVIDAAVEVRGQLDETGSLAVRGFLVKAVGGLPASDGVLEPTGDGFRLALTSGGYRDVMNPSSELQEHVGDRVWITGPDDGPPTAFGLISIAVKDTTFVFIDGRARG